MSSARRVSAIDVAGAVICALVAVALCAMSAQSGWNVTSTYGGGSGVYQALVLGALVVSLFVAILALVALRCLHVAVRRRGIVLVVSALVTLGSMLPPAAFGAAAQARGSTPSRQPAARMWYERCWRSPGPLAGSCPPMAPIVSAAPTGAVSWSWLSRARPPPR